MAALSEVDLKKILGDRYKEGGAIEGDPALLRANAEKLFAATVDKLENSKFSAAALFVLGLVLLAANLSALSGPTMMPVSILAVAMCVAGVAWFLYASKSLKQVRAAGPTVK